MLSKEAKEQVKRRRKCEKKVVAAAVERWNAGEMQEPLPQGKTEWQAYIQKMLQGRRMGGPPEVEAWAMGSGYRVNMYRETKDESGYRKIQEYGREKAVSIGILWKKTRVYEVVWGREEAVKRSTAREGDGEGLCRGAQARVSVGSEKGHSVASSESRPSTCGAGRRWNNNARQHGRGRGERKHWREREKRQETGC